MENIGWIQWGCGTGQQLSLVDERRGGRAGDHQQVKASVDDPGRPQM